MNGTNAIQVHGQSAIVQSSPMGLTEIKDHVRLIQEVMKTVMRENEHYGVIPGCGKKKALFKAGAEKLNLTFRLAPKFEIESQDLGNGHRNFNVRCLLYSITSGEFIGEGVGSCSTMEGKYRFRKAEQVCPECGTAAIRKGSQQYGGGWYCDRKKDGCGAKFEEGDPAIENHDMGRVEHDNPADHWNTCLKIAKKRAHVDATISATAASDIFTQDLEEDDVTPDSGSVKQPENKSAGGKEYQDPETQKRAEIVALCLEMSGGVSKDAKAILEEATAFTGKDGPVAGVKDPSKLTGKRLDIAHGKIHDKYKKWKADAGASPEAGMEPGDGKTTEDGLPF